MKIWKYTLSIMDEQAIEMPEGATLLSVQVQKNAVCLWAFCDEVAPKSLRRIAIYGTGNPMPDSPGKYIATFQVAGGDLVFHAFDKGWWA